MTKPLSPAQIRQLAPRYTINGLFQSGTLGPADEAALEEIRMLRAAFQRFVNPARGWMTPRYASNPPDVPRELGKPPAWRRYRAWRARWSTRIVPPAPGIPWGLTVADVVAALATEPCTFSDMATLAGIPPIELVELFVRSVQDYGRRHVDYQAAAFQRRLWANATAEGAYASARILSPAERRRRARWRRRKQLQRARKGDSIATVV